MNQETYEALKNVIIQTRAMMAEKYANRKRLSQEGVWHKATLTRDIVATESWIDEVAKEYTEEIEIEIEMPLEKLIGDMDNLLELISKEAKRMKNI
jgi:hypothetical protein